MLHCCERLITRARLEKLITQSMCNNKSHTSFIYKDSYKKNFLEWNLLFLSQNKSLGNWHSFVLLFWFTCFLHCKTLQDKDFSERESMSLIIEIKKNYVFYVHSSLVEWLITVLVLIVIIWLNLSIVQYFYWDAIWISFISSHRTLLIERESPTVLFWRFLRSRMFDRASQISTRKRFLYV